MAKGVVNDGGPMASLGIDQTQCLQSRQEPRQFVRLQQAHLLEMPDDEFNRLITEVEKSPLFQRLYRKEKIVRHQRFLGTDIASSFFQLKEEIIADKGSLDVESLLLTKKHIVRQIQELGLEKFKRYFLYPDLDMGIEDTARECDLEVSEVEQINSLVDEFSIMSEFYNPSALNAEHGIFYSKIALIERRPEGFVIGYFSPSFARGVYSINYERFEELKRDGTLNEIEVKEAKQLFKKLELINTRKDTVTRILRSIVERQALYFESGDLRALLPFSQRELAKRISLVPSSISRAIRGRSLDAPWGEEIPLKNFFPQPRRFRRELVKRLLETETKPPTDEAIKNRLEREFGVSISRRSVASLRKELRIPPAWKRKRRSLQQRKL